MELRRAIYHEAIAEAFASGEGQQIVRSPSGRTYFYPDHIKAPGDMVLMTISPSGMINPPAVKLILVD